MKYLKPLLFAVVVALCCASGAWAQQYDLQVRPLKITRVSGGAILAPKDSSTVTQSKTDTLYADMRGVAPLFLLSAGGAAYNYAGIVIEKLGGSGADSVYVQTQHGYDGVPANITAIGSQKWRNANGVFTPLGFSGENIQVRPLIADPQGTSGNGMPANQPVFAKALRIVIRGPASGGAVTYRVKLVFYDSVPPSLN